MKRSTSVTIASVCSLAGSALSLGLGIISALAVVNARKSNPDLNEPVVLGGVVIGTTFLIVPAIWGVATSVGLLRLKSWARISILVFSVLLAITGVCGAVSFPIAAAASSPGSPASLALPRFGIGAFYVTLSGIGIWWFALFTRPSVRQQYVGYTPSLANTVSAQAFERPRANAAASGL